MEAELIADYQCACGEGPVWHPLEKQLYWIDIPTGRIFRYNPATGKHETVYQGDVLGGFTIQEDGSLLLFQGKGTVQCLRNGNLTTVVPEIEDERATRFNDVIADPAGRVFCGTMPTKERPGRLYRLDTDGSIHRVLDGVGCANGMGFTPDRKGMYFTDSNPARAIYLFDYDERSGELSNQRVFAQIPQDAGVPDGMTVDAAGNVWSARWDGGCLVRYAADGSEAERFTFPAKKVSSVIFAGEDYRDLYVTTAGGGKKEDEGAGAGALFRLRLGIQGKPEFFSRIAC